MTTSGGNLQAGLQADEVNFPLWRAIRESLIKARGQITRWLTKQGGIEFAIRFSPSG